MKYWLYLAAKLAAGAGLMTGVWAVLARLLPEPEILSPFRSTWFAQDLRWTTAALVFTLLCAGLVHLIIRDQRMRCRTCLSKLRMPLETGSWSHMLLGGRPHIEYICPYGHGTLRVPEVQVSGAERADWQSHEDMWTELTNTRE